MLTVCCHRSRALNAASVLTILLCTLVSAGAYAAETPALKVLRNIQSLQARHAFLAPELLPPLVELGQLYGAGQCDRAIGILDLALEVSRRHDGLFNPAQLDIYEPLLNCYLTLDRPAELERAQQYVLLIDEQRYGRNDPRLLPTLEQAALRYEEVGLYLSARKLHRRALDIARRNAGEDDLSVVGPLRGMARAYRLEYAYGLALPDILHLQNGPTDLMSLATFDPGATRLDRLGQRSLERAVAVLKSNAGADPDERCAALLELGDWYQLANKRGASLSTYRELWQALHISDAALDAPTNPEILDSPVALLARAQSGHHLRRSPTDSSRLQKYTVDVDYTVTRAGGVTGITVVESNAPKAIEIQVIRELQRTRFRPRFVDGEPVDTSGVHLRQNTYVARRASADTELAAK